MITFDDVSVQPAGSDRYVLRAVDLRIDDGDLCLVVGRTGTGKSTLLKAINGLVPHLTGARLSGRVSVGGRSTRDFPPRQLAGIVGYVGQDPLRGFVTDRVEDEIAYGMEQLGIPSAAMRQRVEETCDLMGIAELRGAALASLSGGQQQRVAIAAVLAAQPRVLVLDEPTSALDATAAGDVLAAITTLVHEVGLTVVLAEHRLERVIQAADQVVWLPGDGTAVSGPPTQVLARADVHPPLADLARELGWDTVPVTVRAARRRVRAERPELVPDTLAAPAAGVPAGEEPARGARSAVAPADRAGATEPGVVARKLTVRYGTRTAVDKVDLELPAGQVTVLMGRNGAGKSSILWALTGTIAASGDITVAGADPRRLDAAHARRLVTLVPQTAADLLYLPTVEQECRQSDRESGQPPGRTAALLRELDRSIDLDADPGDLSEGQRLALVLAIQIAPAPAVLLLDEPTRGLDYTAKARLREILREVAREGRTVAVATHDVEFAAELADQAMIIADGQVIAEGPARAVCTASPAYAPQVAKVFWPRPWLTMADVRAALRGGADPAAMEAHAGGAH